MSIQSRITILSGKKEMDSTARLMDSTAYLMDSTARLKLSGLAMLGFLTLSLTAPQGAIADSTFQKEAAHKVSTDSARIATTLPVTWLLTRSLTRGTELQTDYLPAKRYPVKRIGYWVQKKLPAKVRDLPDYTAIINVASVWPGMQVYPTLRTQNIRIIPVDAAVQLKPEGARVSRQKTAEDSKVLDYFWLNPANLKVMNNIIAEDLTRLWPQYQAQIVQNQQTNDQHISQFSLALDDTLWQQEWDGLCSAQKELNPVLYSLSLPVLNEADVTEGGMNCLWLSDQTSKASVADNKGQPLWQINSLNKLYSGSLEEWLNTNLESLRQVTPSQG